MTYLRDEVVAGSYTQNHEVLVKSVTYLTSVILGLPVSFTASAYPTKFTRYGKCNGFVGLILFCTIWRHVVWSKWKFSFLLYSVLVKMFQYFKMLTFLFSFTVTLLQIWCGYSTSIEESFSYEFDWRTTAVVGRQFGWVQYPFTHYKALRWIPVSHQWDLVKIFVFTLFRPICH